VFRPSDSISRTDLQFDATTPPLPPGWTEDLARGSADDDGLTASAPSDTQRESGCQDEVDADLDDVDLGAPRVPPRLSLDFSSPPSAEPVYQIPKGVRRVSILEDDAGNDVFSDCSPELSTASKYNLQAIIQVVKRLEEDNIDSQTRQVDQQSALHDLKEELAALKLKSTKLEADVKSLSSKVAELDSRSLHCKKCRRAQLSPK
jgi:cell division protein FtsB